MIINDREAYAKVREYETFIESCDPETHTNPEQLLKDCNQRRKSLNQDPLLRKYADTREELDWHFTTLEHKIELRINRQ